MVNAQVRGRTVAVPRQGVARPTAGRAAVPTALLTGLVIALSIASTVLAAAPASATTYRFWSYWQGASGQWEMAQTGPGDHRVVDRDVQGWRFAIATETVSATPDNSPDFAALCPDLAAGSAPAGQLRVAVVIDAGFAADAPEGQTPPADVVSCVTVPAGSTGAQAVAAAGTVIDSGGMVCSINGYPADECAAAVPDDVASTAAEAAATESPNPAVVGEASASPTAPTPAASSPAGFLAGALVLAALLGASIGIPVLRRRRHTDDQG